MNDIKKFLDRIALQKIQDQFYESTGLAAVVTDAEGNYITKGSGFSGFSHVSLTDFSTDIIINGEKVGAIIGGFPKELQEETFQSAARGTGVNEDLWGEEFKTAPIRSQGMIQASAQMLGNVVNQLVNLEYIKTIAQKRNDIFDSEIGKIQRSLSEVTNKTHDLQKVASMESILSINASIEAARAGEAGVGFAVVAREFGDISKNSGAVYQRIHELVKEMEDAVRNLTEIG